ncbi:MAG: DUF5710 domain-containing protein [Sulfurimonas sp.]|jgi:hypothetical protein
MAFIDRNIYLNVPFNEKELAKSLGAKWNQKTQKWVIPFNETTELDKIFRWFPPKIEKQMIELSDYSIVEKFKKLESRFKCGKEVLDYLGIKRENISIGTGFCAQCDSHHHGCWVVGSYCLHHAWNQYNGKPLSQKEVFILEEYLSSSCKN